MKGTTMGKKVMLLDVPATYQSFLKIAQEKGMSIYSISKATGYAPQYMCKWKNGVALPKTDKLWAMADFLEVSIDELVGRKIPKKKSK